MLAKFFLFERLERHPLNSRTDVSCVAVFSQRGYCSPGEMESR
jgi:hypothetical protein